MDLIEKKLDLSFLPYFITRKTQRGPRRCPEQSVVHLALRDTNISPHLLGVPWVSGPSSLPAGRQLELCGIKTIIFWLPTGFRRRYMSLFLWFTFCSTMSINSESKNQISI